MAANNALVSENVSSMEMNLTGGNNGSNVTLAGVENEFQFVLTKIVTPILYGIISVVGVIGNCLVIYVILSNQKMRTVTNLLLLNLAIADLSFVCVVPPSTAYLSVTSTWPFGNIACKMMHYLVNVTAYVTVYTLVLISVIRFMTVVHNVRTAAIRTRRNVVVMIVGIWVIMLLLNIPILNSYRGFVRDDGLPDCDNDGEETGKRIFATFFVFAYLVPLAVIGIFSIAILCHIGKNRSAILVAKDKKSRSGNKKKQASQLLVLVVVLFAMFWLPVHIHLLSFFFVGLPSSEWYNAASILFYVLAYFNSCVNPIIYNRTSKEFRDAFREAVICCRKNNIEAAVDEPRRKPRTICNAATKETDLSSAPMIQKPNRDSPGSC